MTQNPPNAPHLADPILTHARKDFSALESGMSVAEALESIRQRGVGEKIAYFYPKIVAGPVTLALTDIFTLLFYFTLAAWLL